MDTTKGLKAIASKPRLQILAWLKSPAEHFGPQPVGDLQQDGVTAAALMKKLGCRQPTLSEHVAILEAVGFVETKRIGRYVLYKRDEDRIKQFKREFMETFG